MKPFYLLIVLELTFVLFGCLGSEPKACTMEAKLCPDGSAVGRNSSNNCEFDPCPYSQFCDATTPCERGTCYKFQDFDRPICWEGSDPCVRCDSKKCSILESYPAQIVCQKITPLATPNTTIPKNTTPPSAIPPVTPPAPENNLTDCSIQQVPDDCYYKAATSQKDASICFNIAAPNKRNGCYYVVALQTKDGSSCGRITDDYLRDQCDNLFNQP